MEKETESDLEGISIQKLGGDLVLVSGAANGMPEAGFDNCAVCQLMRRAKDEDRQPTQEELLEAMEKANASVLGGETSQH